MGQYARGVVPDIHATVFDNLLDLGLRDSLLCVANYAQLTDTCVRYAEVIGDEWSHLSAHALESRSSQLAG